MENYQLLTIIGTNLLVFLGFMSTVIALHIQGNKRIDAIQEEMKDFHARLCVIEEKRK